MAGDHMRKILIGKILLKWTLHNYVALRCVV